MRLRRIRALEFALYAHGHRQFENAFNELPEADRYSMILLQTHMTYEKQFRSYNIQEARLERLRSKKLDELARLQAGRTDEPEHDSTADPDEMSTEELAQVEAMMEAHFARLQAAPATSLPQNGFDFSNGVPQPSNESPAVADSCRATVSPAQM